MKGDEGDQFRRRRQKRTSAARGLAFLFHLLFLHAFPLPFRQILGLVASGRRSDTGFLLLFVLLAHTAGGPVVVRGHGGRGC